MNFARLSHVLALDPVRGVDHEESRTAGGDLGMMDSTSRERCHHQPTMDSLTDSRETLYQISQISPRTYNHLLAVYNHC